MDRLPQRIGPYAIVGLLGEGGSGKVYLAEQTEPLRRTVALKVLESIGGGERMLARFEIERLALAVMDHPSIAKIFDAGVTDDGHPYVVMERVDGIPIGQYCDERRLTIRQRVALFAEACRAVHHAHQKGLIHRDLKPSHLLVTEDEGRPRLRIIDFGIAMAMEGANPTLAGRDDREVVGTPGYMSPEQMEGSTDVDTRSDIYSLGVILYELLVGVPPFDPGRRRGWAAVAAQLGDLPTPTRRLVSLDDTQDTLASHRSTTPRGLRRALHGDLDSIVARAMSKDRADRYETARDSWLDLDRYLTSRPVEARDGGLFYKARKFTRRNRVGVAFGGVVLAGAVAVGVTGAVQAARVADARDEASLRRSQAEALIDFMLTDLRDRLEPIGRLDVLDAVGDQALEYFAATPETGITEEELFRRVTALTQIGDVRSRQGNLPAARDAYQAALEVNLDLVERSPDNADWLVGLGIARYGVGYVDWRMRDFDSALEHFREYLAISEALVARDPTNIDWQTELAYAHSNIGSVLEDQGELEAAAERFSAALGTFEELAAREPQNGDRWLDVADTHNTLGDVRRGQGRLPEALAHYRQDVDLKQDLVELDSTHTFWRERLAFGNIHAGEVSEAVGEFDSAMAHFTAAQEEFRSLVAHDSTNADWLRGLVQSRWHAASIMEARGDRPAALAELRDIEPIRRELSALDPTDPRSKGDEAATYAAVARVLQGLGRHAEALTSATRARSILDTLVQRSPDDRQLLGLSSEVLNVLGAARGGLGDSEAATAAWTEALRTIEPVAEDSDDVRYVVPWARALLRLDRVDDARPVLERLAALGYRDDALAALAESKNLTTSLRVP